MTTTADAAPDAGAQLRAALVEDLTTRGHLRTPRWQQAFTAVPREAFVDRFTVLREGDVPAQWAVTDPGALEAIYRDHPLVTQTDDGGTPTSSSSAPSLMALMLEALNPAGHVLEIGTGTGYNAALLTHALGDQHVTTIEMHPDLADRARARLHHLGYHPAVIAGDGAAGHPPRAPYHHLIATCGLTRLPAAWRHQLHPGATLLFTLGYALAHLTLDDRRRAHGPLTEYASFMPLRPHPAHQTPTATALRERAQGEARQRPAPWLDALETPAAVALRSLHLPHLKQVLEEHPDGPEYVFLDEASGSWARARRTDEAHCLVREAGPRSLWRQLEILHEEWTTLGRPEITAYELTVTEDGHTLTHPASRRSWPLP